MNWLKGWHLLFDEYNACFTAIEAGWTDSIATQVSIDENNASSIAVEAGWTGVIVYAYSAMKITRVSLQSKLDELMSLSTRTSRVNVCSNDIS